MSETIDDIFQNGKRYLKRSALAFTFSLMQILAVGYTNYKVFQQPRGQDEKIARGNYDSYHRIDTYRKIGLACTVGTGVSGVVGFYYLGRFHKSQSG